MFDLISNFYSAFQLFSGLFKRKCKKHVKKLEYSNENLNEVFNSIQSEHFEDPDFAYLLSITIEDDFEWFDLQEFTNMFSNKSIVIHLVSNDTWKFQIAWKSSEIQNFIFLKPYTDEFDYDDEDVHEFIANVLAETLKNGHLGLEKNYQPDLDSNLVDIYQIVDSHSSNLLSIANKAGNVNLVSKFESLKLYLLDKDKGPHHQTLAIKNEHYDAVLALYEEDIPILLTREIETCSEEVEQLFQKLYDLNRYLINDQVEKVKKIFHQLPRSSHCLNLKNESALKVALQYRSFRSYEFLWSQGIRFAPHESPRRIFNFLNEKQNIVRRIFNKYAGKCQERHVQLLVAKSVLFNDSENPKRRFKVVKMAFETLSSNPLIKPILVAVAEYKNVRISIDFNTETEVDSSACGESYLLGRIYVKAKQLLDEERQHETLGNLAHQLCLLALHLVYKNNGKPYRCRDQKATKNFEEIVDKFEESKATEDINDKPDQHAELMAWTVQMLATFQKEPEQLIEFKKEFDEILKFYQKKVIPDLSRSLPEIKIRSLIEYRTSFKYHQLSQKELTKLLDAVVIYKGVEVKFKDLFPDSNSIYRNLKIDHLMCLLDGQILDLSDPYFRYIDNKISHCWKDLAGSLKDKVLDSSLTFQNQKLLFSELHWKCPSSFNFLKSYEIESVLDGKELVLEQMPQTKESFYMERTFVDAKLDAANVEDIFEGPGESRITKMPCQARTNQKLTFDDILNQTKQSRMFILSSEAGTGKTRTFEEFSVRIKQKFPNFWVSLIDLRDHIKLFSQTNYLKDVKGLLSEILDLKYKTKFEQKVFEELFDFGNVVLLWNGLDDVLPTYGDFVLDVMTSIHSKTKNVQYVCIKPLYSDLLTSKFGVNGHTLVPFDAEEQIELLTRSFTSVGVEEDNLPEYIEKFHKIVEKLTWKGQIQSAKDLKDRRIDQNSFNSNNQASKATNSNNSNFISPLMIKMIATTITKPSKTFNSANIWDIYEHFINTKIQVWKEQVGFEFSHHTDTEHFETMQMFQMYALKAQSTKFPFRTGLIIRKLNIMTQKFPEELTNEEIARMGILHIHGPEKFEFSHRRFEEFFVAQFLIDTVYRGVYVEPEDAVLIIQLFVDVIKMFGTEQVMITRFMQSFLDSKISQNSRNFHTNLSKVLLKKFKFLFFELLMPKKDKSEEIAEFLFKFFSKDQKLLVKMLHVDENETLYTATDGWEVLRTLGEKYLKFDEFEIFLNGKEREGVEMFSMYCGNLNGRQDLHHNSNPEPETLQTKDATSALTKIAENLTQTEVQELFLSASSPITSNALEIIRDERFWKVVDQFLLESSDKKVLISNLFYKIATLAEFSNFILIVIQKSEKIITDSEILDLFLTKNILHMAAARKDLRIFSKLWTFFVSHTTEKQQKQILLREVDGINFNFNSKGYPVQNCYQYPKFNIFHILLIFSNDMNWDTEDGLVNNKPQMSLADSIKSIEIYDKYFEKSRLREILLRSNSFLPYFIHQNETQECEKFINWLKSLFKDEKAKLKEFILRKIEQTDLNIFEIMDGKIYDLKPIKDLLSI